MSEYTENSATERQDNNGNSALDWEIFDILCRDDLGLNVSLPFYYIIDELQCVYWTAQFAIGNKIKQNLQIANDITTTH